MKKKIDLIAFVLVLALALLLHIITLYGMVHHDVWTVTGIRNVLLIEVLNLPFCILLAVADYGIIRLTKKFFSQRWKIQRLTADVVIATIISVAVGCLLNRVFAMTFRTYSLQETSPLILINICLVFILEAHLAGQILVSAKQHIITVEREKALYQFEALKNQLNPHFLFNCFNTLASLTRQDPERANLFVKRLAGVYRYLLSTNEQPLVPIADELKFVRDYCTLEQIRFGEHLHISISGSAEWMVVPASLQMLVENAIKHNVCNEMNPLFITIDIGAQCISVYNNLQPRTNTISTGIGLKNLAEQYALQGLYLDYTKKSGVFRVEIRRENMVE